MVCDFFSTVVCKSFAEDIKTLDNGLNVYK